MSTFLDHVRRWSARGAFGVVALASLAGLPNRAEPSPSSQTEAAQAHKGAAEASAPANTAVAVAGDHQQAGADGGGSANQTFEHPQVDQIRITDWIMALSAIASAMFAGALAVLTRRLFIVGRNQHEAMLQSNEAATSAANAAKEAAEAATKQATVAERALIELERPVLVLDMSKARGVSRGAYGDWGFGGSLTFGLANHGKSAAVLRSIDLRGVVTRGDLPSTFLPEDNKGGHSFPAGVALGPGEADRELSHSILADIGLEELPTAKNPGALFFQGFVVYTSMVGAEFTLGWCAAFMGDRWVLIGDHRYCYERIRDAD